MNNQKFDETLLTSYVLGELSQEEMQQVETWAAKSTENQEQLNEIKATINFLSSEMKSTSKPELKPEQKSQLNKTLSSRDSKVYAFWKTRQFVGFATAGLIAFTVVSLIQQESPEELSFVAVKNNPTPNQEAQILTDKDGSTKGVSNSSPPNKEVELNATAVKPSAGSPQNIAGGKALVRSRGQIGKAERHLKKRLVPQAIMEADVVGSRPAPSIAPPGGYIPPYKPRPSTSGESYDSIQENSFLSPLKSPLSTFSIDVDTASYSNLRRMINYSQSIPNNAVRIEEMINYFPYNYEAPRRKEPFAVHIEHTKSPWSKNNIVRIGLKGKDIPWDKRPQNNLVFLLDVSGSMNSPNKLPLLKTAFTMLIDKLNEKDTVSIVVYAGAAGVVLEPTEGSEKNKIITALDQLQAGGSTNGGQGIAAAYKLAQDHFIKGGNNRVILATDGDFNVGTVNRQPLNQTIKQYADKGIYLSILGFGMGNYQDGRMEDLSNKGNGNYAYIDTIREARKVLVEQMMGTLVTIAKDVKIQVEFNPKFVGYYRLIGYENRKMAAQDFANDKKDAGEIGAGHTVTALYEVVPAGQTPDAGTMPKLKYQKVDNPKSVPVADIKPDSELLTVKLRYKAPNATQSKLMEFPLKGLPIAFEKASESTRFASAVALFGMLLKGSQYSGTGTYSLVRQTASGAKGSDKGGYRAEFLQLVEKVSALKPNNQ
tara:strand:- start:103534 stop:105660 length:2127 start_codon:yes stop_codon:yes gene_type:complete